MLVYKSLQRKVLSIVNTRLGLLLFFLGCLCLVIEIFRMFASRTFLLGYSTSHVVSSESKQPTNNYFDNIGGINMEKNLAYDPIDVVYTWVNGSDPIWLAQKKEWQSTVKAQSNQSLQNYSSSIANNTLNLTSVMNESHVVHNTSIDSSIPLNISETSDDNRYRDSDELRYSIRSLYKYAPWIRRIYLVTDNQIPNWLDLKTQKHLVLISHEGTYITV